MSLLSLWPCDSVSWCWRLSRPPRLTKSKGSGQTMWSPDSLCVPAKSDASSEMPKRSWPLTLVVLLALQVRTFPPSAPVEARPPTSAIADVEPVRVAGPFQLAQAEFVHPLRSGTPEPTPVGLPVASSGNARTMESCEGQRQANPRCWSRSIVRHHRATPEFHVELCQHRKARRTRRNSISVDGQGQKLARPNPADNHHHVARIVVCLTDLTWSPCNVPMGNPPAMERVMAARSQRAAPGRVKIALLR